MKKPPTSRSKRKVVILTDLGRTLIPVVGEGSSIIESLGGSFLEMVHFRDRLLALGCTVAVALVAEDGFLINVSLGPVTLSKVEPSSNRTGLDQVVSDGTTLIVALKTSTYMAAHDKDWFKHLIHTARNSGRIILVGGVSIHRDLLLDRIGPPAVFLDRPGVARIGLKNQEIIIEELSK